jgi:L-fucose mutarotase
MLKTGLTHPDILLALGRAGHGSRILIADGNYPCSTTLGKNASLVSLNLSPGLVSCVQVLEALVTVIPIEAAAVMQPMSSGPYALTEDPAIWAEFDRTLKGSGYTGALERVERFAFYEQAKHDDVCLVIATGETRIYANLLLTLGVTR